MRTAQNGNRRRASLCSPVLFFQWFSTEPRTDTFVLGSHPAFSYVFSADGGGRVRFLVNTTPDPDSDRIPSRRPRDSRRRRRQHRQSARRRGDAERRILSDARERRKSTERTPTTDGPISGPRSVTPPSDPPSGYRTLASEHRAPSAEKTPPGSPESVKKEKIKTRPISLPLYSHYLGLTVPDTQFIDTHGGE